MANKYAAALRALLSPAEVEIFETLRTPIDVQNYLDHLPINFELAGETIYSPRRVLRHSSAHCVEGALFAAASLAYQGRTPWILDIQTAPCDDDHVLALFKEDGHWGAISKTNHTILRWRDPVYRSIRELAMSYFHEYIVVDGEKTMRAFSKPFDLSRYGHEWVVAEHDLVDLIVDLDDSPHFPIAPKHLMKRVRYAQPIETKVLNIVEWLPSGKKTKIK
jgi:hypothetical protein